MRLLMLPLPAVCPDLCPLERMSLEVLTNTLGVPLGTAKAMVFKKRGLLAMAPDELLDRVRTVADVVGVTTDQAIEMVTIQPGLLFDTQVGWLMWVCFGRHMSAGLVNVVICCCCKH
jgi:hypothetical protein